MTEDSAIDWLLTKHPEASADEVLDALWLAAQGVLSPVTTRAAAVVESEEKRPPTPAALKAPSEKPAMSSPATPLSPPNKPDPSEPQVDLVLPNLKRSDGAGAPSSGRGGLALRIPGARALPGAADLLRALRPLRRRVESRRQVLMDVEATVHRVAAEGLWLPVMRPMRARWLDLALVIEASRTMVLWRETLRELRRVLEQAGAFRDVRVWWLDSLNPQSPVLRVQPEGVACNPRELIAADGRRAILLATDCLSPAWSMGALTQLLRVWGARQPVAILQMLPRRLWPRTALHYGVSVHAGAPEPGLPNRRLGRQLAQEGTAGEAPVGTPIPLLTTEPGFVAAWARLVGRGNPPEMPAVIFPSAPPTPPLARSRTSPPKVRMSLAEEASLAAARIERFKQNASPLAFRLIRLLAAAPLRLPVMRLVQRSLLPESGQVDLAEVFLGGLVRRRSAPNVRDPDLVDYDFLPGVRKLLLDAARLDEAVEVQTTVSQYLADRFGQALDFLGMVKSPEAAPDLPDFKGNSEFARVSAEVLRRMGGRYAQLARRLERVGAGRSTTASRAGGAASGSEPSSETAPKNAESALSPASKPEVAQTVQPTIEAPVPLPGARILWVDDYPENNTPYARQLRELGAWIKEVRSSAEALDQLHADQFHFVISDIGRGEDRDAGPNLVAQARKTGNQTPFVFFSTRSEPLSESMRQAQVLVQTNSVDELFKVLLAAFPAEVVKLAARPFSPGRENRIREFLQDFNIFRRFAAEDNDAAGLLSAEPSEYQWELLWRELWRQAQTAPNAWKLVLRFMDAAVGTGYVQVWRLGTRTLSRVASLLASGSNDYAEASLEGIIGRAARTGRTVVVPDVSLAPDYIAAEAATCSEVAVPVPVPADGATDMGNMAGVLNFESRELNAFPLGRVRWLERLAGSLAHRLTAEPVAAPLETQQGVSREAYELWRQLSELPPRIGGLVAARMTYRWFGLLPPDQWASPSAQLVEARDNVEGAEFFASHPGPHESLRSWFSSQWSRARAALQEPGPATPGLGPAAQWLAGVAALMSANDEGAREVFRSEASAGRFASLPASLSGQSYHYWVVALREDLKRAVDFGPSVSDLFFEQFRAFWPTARAKPFFGTYPPKPTFWVCVAGLEQATADTTRAAEMLGRVLAAGGFGLVTGTHTGVEAIAGQAFSRRATGWLPPGSRPRIVVGDRGGLMSEHHVWENQDVEELEVADVEAAIQASLQRSDALILISGAGGTARVGREARRLGIPILPVGGSGGDAARFLEELSETASPGLAPDEIRLLGGDPLPAIALMPRLLRKLRREVPRPAASASDPAGVARASPLENVLGLSWGGDQPQQTAFLLRNPHVIVTDAFGWRQLKTKPSQVRLWDNRGNQHIARVVHVGRGGRDFGPVLVKVPTSLDRPGFALRREYPEDPAGKTTARFRDIQRVTYVVAAGDRMGMATAKILSPEEVVTRIAPLSHSSRVIRLEASVSPGSSGSPVLDESGQICGFIVAGSHDTAEAYLLPGYLWAEDLRTPAGRPKTRAILPVKTQPSPPSPKKTVAAKHGPARPQPRGRRKKIASARKKK